MKINLEIGGCHIQLDEGLDHKLGTWPLKPFGSFLTGKDSSPDLLVEVKVTETLPSLPHGSLRFDACHGLWKLYEAGSGFVLISADTESLRPRCEATVTADFSRVRVWTSKHNTLAGTKWTPMHVINPIVEVCLLTKLAREGGILLHAMGALVGKDGWVFTGASGAGKSTLSGMFSSRGAAILSDERIIIKGVQDTFLLYGTPWVGMGQYGQNLSGVLTALFCISHGRDQHVVEGVTRRSLIHFLLEQCFLPYWDRQAMDRTLSTITDVADRIPCNALAFLKNPNIVDFLAARDPRPLVTAP